MPWRWRVGQRRHKPSDGHAGGAGHEAGQDQPRHSRKSDGRPFVTTLHRITEVITAAAVPVMVVSVTMVVGGVVIMIVLVSV